MLLACARTRTSEEASARVRTLIAGGVDWPQLMEAAREHGVTPLVCRQLLTNFADVVPVEWHVQLRARFEENAQRNLSLAREMVRLSSRFRAEGLPAVPYKGPLLAAQAYGDLALRQFADLDFLMRQRDIPRVQALLLSDGYEAVFGAISEDEGARPTHSEYQFNRPAGRVTVEMQTETTLRYFPRLLDLEGMNNRKKQTTLGGEEIFSFSAEDTLILLAVHGSKHFWERLMWIADIAELAQAKDGVVWPVAFERADEVGVGRMLRLGLWAAHDMLDAPLPDDVLQKVQSDPVTRRLGEGIRARYFRVRLTPLPVFSRFRFRVATRDSFWQGWRYALRLATTPTDPDRTAMPLPANLSRAHAWLRPFLLIKRYGIRRSKSGEPPKT
jgi:hypothetical protein